MASVTLAESAKLAQDMLVAGVIEDVITVNQIFEVFPFDGISGNALAYNRENVLGGVGLTGIGTVLGSGDANPLTSGSAEAKNAATFTQYTSGLTTIIGDAEVNGLIQATRSSDGNDQTAIQVASKAKHCGRLYQWLMVNGNSGTANQFDGLLLLCASGQKTTPATDGSALSLAILDELLDLVTAKDGNADYIMMNSRERRAYRALLRALGGAAIMEVVEMPSGAKVMSYSEVPVFKNDYIPINQTYGNATNASSVICGTFDDGSRCCGVAGLTAEEAAGIVVEDVGTSETKDERITRVKWYSGMALFTEKGLAVAPGVIPA
jgi:hypothetical protein